ncbi:histidine kinase [Shewanella sp. Choline-02u-19]|uniref:HDOD domain-containing protein n=1 Tax=unclassified Shewanella TaxID=196818 RepID=UPI000C34804E|nr:MULTISPECIES: HDOD domain-containing protein [unclassified Shewanella]PKG57707.1 histidine kinase [Shewanella sp. GutDb-MelDb]PKG74545.1 histidine kinase [Shewanella sp. GutCb]PKH55472.1 histidine kinase [Shewanella sp. Bg11-22]PKI28819.1 histidine kinase [Shewanella sp. Choline-02u-19]
MAISVAGGVKPGKIIEIEHRLQELLIVGKGKPVSIPDEIHAELEDDANKLEIERDAIRARIEKQNKAQALYKVVSAQLITSVNRAIEHQLSSPELVLEHSKLDEKQILLLELLYSKRVDLSRIRPLVMDLPWLQRDLVNMINSPMFRHRRPQTSDIQVTDIKLVLNYIGIENLQALIPYFCLRYLMPSGQPQLLWVTRKLWRYSVISAIAAQALVELHNKDRAFAYSCSLMSQLGTTCVISNCAKMFDATLGSWLREASASGDKELYDAIMATEFPAIDVYQQALTHSGPLNWQLLNQLSFEQSRLTKTFKAIDESLKYADLDEDSALIERANCFARVYLLKEAGNITSHECRLMYDYYEISEQELIRLNGKNYRKLALF